MAFTPGNITSNGSTSGDSLTITKPSGVGSGDLLFAHIAWEITGGTADGTITTAPSGWTLLQKNGVSNLSSAIYYKITGSSEPANYSWSGFNNWSEPNSDQIFGIIAHLPGQAVDTPINGSNEGSSASTTTATTAGVTPSIANCAILLTYSSRNAATFSGYALATSSPTFTELFDGNQDNIAISLAYGIRPETTSTGNGTATMSSTQSVTGYMVAVAQGVDVSFDADLFNISMQKGEPAFTPNLLHLDMNLRGGNVSGWSSTQKSSTSWVNTDKSDE